MGKILGSSPYQLVIAGFLNHQQYYPTLPLEKKTRSESPLVNALWHPSCTLAIVAMSPLRLAGDGDVEVVLEAVKMELKKGMFENISVKLGITSGSG